METYETFATQGKGKLKKLLAICIMFIAILLCFGINKSQVEAAEPFGELYEINENYITKILPQTTLKDLKNNLELEDEESLQVIDQDGVEKQDNELVGTNMILKIREEEYKLSVVGDVNGDGKITITDVTKIKLDQINIKKIEEEYKISADINCDGRITITDLVQVNLISISIKDKIAPVSFMPEVTVNGNAITVEGSTSDENSGVAEYYFKIDNGEWVQNEDKTNSIHTFENVGNAVHIVRMKVKDNAGNEKITGAVKTNAVEGEINIYPSTLDWTNENITVSIDYKANIGEVRKLISIDGGVTFEEYTGPVTIDKNTQIVARLVSDVYGIINQASIQIQNIDKLAPEEINVEATANKQTIAVNAVATDTQATENYGESGIKEYKYTIKKDLWEWTKETEENTCEFSNLTKGETYIVQVTAIDNAGNELISEEIEVKIGNFVTLTIDANGGTGVGLGNASQEEGTSIELPEPSKDGYIFKEWELSGDGSIEGNIYTYGELPGTVTAIWEPITYTVEYNENGATSGTTENSTHTYDEAKELTQNGYKREYTITYETNGGDTIPNDTAEYTFAGWATEENGLKQYEDKEEVSNLSTTNNGTVTIYAVWDDTTASITLPTPTKEGYTFKGWYEDISLTNKITDSTYTPTKDLTLYADWEINEYTLVFEAYGGEVTPARITQDYGTAITLPTPTREHTVSYDTNGGNTITSDTYTYNFVGWYTSLTDGVEKTYTTMPAYDETLYAIWNNTNAGITLPVPTKEGYTFSGWYTDSEFSNKITDSTYTPTENITLYAKWDVNQYTLTFDANEGEVTESSITEDYNTNITLPIPTRTHTVIYDTNGGNTITSDTYTYNFVGWYTALTDGVEKTYTTMPAYNETLYAIWNNTNAGITLPVPTKDGYTFKGWYEDSSLTNKITDSTYTPTKDLTLYADWEVNKYTLTFDANEGIVSPTSIIEEYGESITLPIPTREYTVAYDTNGGDAITADTCAYTFDGWYTATTGGEKREYTTMPLGNETLYAHWTSTSVTLPTPTKDGYTFAGWYEDNTFATKIGDAGEYYTPTENTTLYAKWTVNGYTLTFDANDGDMTPTSITEDYGTAITMPTPTREHIVTYDTNGGNTIANSTATYTFTGWYTATTGGEKKEYTTMPAGDETLYAQWDNTTAKVTLPMPTKTGYTFKGWYEDNTFATTAGNAGDYYTPTTDTTLYAKWEINEYTLTFDANGGDVTPASITEEYGTSITLPTLTKTGYTFKGWYTESAGGVERTYTTMPAGDETLYAQWEINTSSITIDANGGNVEITTDTAETITTSKTYTQEYNTTLDYGTPTKADTTATTNYTVTFNYNDENIENTEETATKTIVTEYTFSGWTKSDPFYGALSSETANGTYTFGTENGVTSTITANYTDSEKSNTTTSITLPTPAVEGRVFDGWYGDSEFVTKVGNAGDEYTPSEDITLYAAWQGIYVKLYDDGTLTFCSTNKEIEGKTLASSYGDIMGNEFSASNYTPWGTSSITTVDIVDEIKPTSTAYWFVNCTNLTTINNISNLNTSNVTDMKNMFSSCRGLTSLNVSSFDTSNVTDMSYMFYNCSGLTTLNVSSFDTSNVTDMKNMFSSCRGLTSLNVSSFDTSNVTDMSYMFYNCSGLTTLNVSSFDTSNVTDMSYMFYNCSSLTSLNLSSFNTSNVTTMQRMFQNCSGLTTLNVSSFDTSNVTDMQSMFANCKGLTSLDVSSLNTSNVTDMSYMFCNCSSLTSLNLSSFNTSNVTTMQYMFKSCSSLTSLNLSSFNASNVISMKSMFESCTELTSLDLSSFNTSNVTDMSFMFRWSSGLTSINLSNFDTSNVTSLSGVFINCSGLTSLDLTSFTTSDAVTTDNLFYGCSKLTKINVSSSKWKITTYGTGAFTGCGTSSVTYN